MQEWINNNLSILVTLGLAVFGAGGWLGFSLNRHYERKKDRQQSMKELSAENKKLQEALERYKMLELSEEKIDKSRGTIYMEKLDSGNSRAICGFCWEREHIKIPVIPEPGFSNSNGQSKEWAYCQNCSKSLTYYRDDKKVKTNNGNINEYQKNR